MVLIFVGRIAGYCALCAFKSVMEKAKHERVIAPHKLYKNIRSICRHFQIGMQEDSQEFIVNFLDKFQEINMKDRKLEKEEYFKSDIFSIFGGFLRSRVCWFVLG